MATEMELVIIAPRLVLHHKAPAPPVVVVKSQAPKEKTQYRTYIFPIHSEPGGKHQTHMYQVWNTNLLQGKLYPQANTGKAKGSRPQGKEEWGNIQLLVWSYRLWRGIYQ